MTRGWCGNEPHRLHMRPSAPREVYGTSTLHKVVNARGVQRPPCAPHGIRAGRPSSHSQVQTRLKLDVCCLRRFRMVPWRSTNDVKVRALLGALHLGYHVLMVWKSVPHLCVGRAVACVRVCVCFCGFVTLNNVFGLSISVRYLLVTLSRCGCCAAACSWTWT
jgi:hypothetical protein